MKRKHVVYLIMAVCLVFGGLLAAQTKEDINFHKDCKYCGMSRGMYDFSRMLIEYDDGTAIAVCSTHCAAVELANNIDKTPKAIKVGDFIGKQLIDAENLLVVGGKRRNKRGGGL
jgi:hypothetical protein